jgi:hypothetical protein
MKLKSLLSENEKVNAYVAAVLTEKSRQELISKVTPVHPNVVAHHVTMAFNPTKQEFDTFYASYIGRTIPVTIVGVAQDDKAQAVTVLDVPSNNKNPHITLSLADKVPAKYSNELLEKATVTPISLKLEAVIELIPLKK